MEEALLVNTTLGVCPSERKQYVIDLNPYLMVGAVAASLYT